MRLPSLSTLDLYNYHKVVCSLVITQINSQLTHF